MTKRLSKSEIEAQLLKNDDNFNIIASIFILKLLCRINIFSQYQKISPLVNTDKEVMS